MTAYLTSESLRPLALMLARDWYTRKEIAHEFGIGICAADNRIRRAAQIWTVCWRQADYGKSIEYHITDFDAIKVTTWREDVRQALTGSDGVSVSELHRLTGVPKYRIRENLRQIGALKDGAARNTKWRIEP
jgi:hypothetical protein